MRWIGARWHTLRKFVISNFFKEIVSQTYADLRTARRDAATSIVAALRWPGEVCFSPMSMIR
jgi:hypothetical protein